MYCKKVLMVGASNGGQMMSSILEESHPGIIIDFIDDNKKLWDCFVYGKKVLPYETNDICNIIKDYDYAFVGIGLHKLMNFRKKIVDAIGGKIPFINIIHKTAYISLTSVVGEGNYIGAFSYVGPYTKIGSYNFFSANTIIEHHNNIGSFNLWGPSNTTSGMCEIGDYVCFGTKISMIFSLSIGHNSFIASGVVLDKSVDSNSVVRKNINPNYSISLNKRRV
jgi:acetyltransferase-like isoleucine patch superfamily enzyme